jgi:TRAP-type C4-dicarboxylate transport system permease small subunit
MSRLLKFYDLGPLLTFCAMFMCVGIEVIGRNILMLPTTWAEEMARFFCVWSVFLEAASAWYRGAHISIVVLLTRLPDKPQKWLRATVEAVCALFVLAVLVGTVILMQESYESKTVALEMSISVFYLGLLIGLSGMLLFSGHRIVSIIKT